MSYTLNFNPRENNMLKKLLVAAAAALLCASVHAQNQLSLDRDAGGFGTYTPYLISAPTYTDAKVLSAGVSKTATVPTGARFVIFSGSCSAYYARPGASAAVPVGDVSDGTAPMLNPAGWAVRSISQITLISAGSCTVTLTWYL